MTSDWVAATTFEQTHEVLFAINTLSIHAKLMTAGVEDPAPDSEMERARARLLILRRGTVRPRSATET